jgi:prepilin peptidase CpaA
MPSLAAVLCVGVFATLIDIRTRRIPNVLTASAGLVGLLMAARGASGLSVGAALGGAAMGFCLMLPGHLFGATGAGDVKLLAAFGALLGPGPIVTAFLYSAIAGGVLAIAVSVQRGRFRTTMRATARLLASPAGAQTDIDRPAANNRFPYGPAIAVGTAVSAVLGM